MRMNGLIYYGSKSQGLVEIWKYEPCHHPESDLFCTASERSEAYVQLIHEIDEIPGGNVKNGISECNIKNK